MIFKKSQSLRSYLNGINAKTLMIFCNDCQMQAMESAAENITVRTQSGLVFMDSNQESLDALLMDLKEGGFVQVILVGHYPCIIHNHLNKGLKSSPQWIKVAERTRENFLKLESDGIRHLSDKEFSFIHLQQQLTFFGDFLFQEPGMPFKIPVVKGLLWDKENQVTEVGMMKFTLTLN